jgi:plasmid segregation protein ParM
LSNTLPVTTLDALGVDVGFFETKFTCHRAHGRHGGTIVAEQFPSLAPRDKGIDLTLPNIQKADIVKIEVEPGVAHLVGKDVEIAVHGFGTKAVTPDYSRGTAYKALFLGALHSIARANAVRGEEMHVETLVGGLPLSSIRTHSRELREFMQQSHTVPHPADKERSLRVIVRNALVMAQPQGALQSHHSRNGSVDREATTLVLDMGGGTFDWFVAKGNSANLNLCGAAPIGALACATAICDQVDPEFKHSALIMARVDQALRTGAESFRVSSTSYRMSQYGKVVRGVLHDAIEQMSKSVGNLRDMDAILFTGGAAGLLYEACKDEFPAFTGAMTLDGDPVTSNVRGFHLWAEHYNLVRKTSAPHGR